MMARVARASRSVGKEASEESVVAGRTRVWRGEEDEVGIRRVGPRCEERGEKITIQKCRSAVGGL